MLSVSKKRKKTFYLFILSLIGINNRAHKRRADKGGHKHRTESKALSALWVNEARPWKDARILSPLFPRLQGWRSTLSSDQAFRTCKRGCGYIRMPTYSCRLTLIFDEQCTVRRIVVREWCRVLCYIEINESWHTPRFHWSTYSRPLNSHSYWRYAVMFGKTSQSKH